MFFIAKCRTWVKIENTVNKEIFLIDASRFIVRSDFYKDILIKNPGRKDFTVSRFGLFWEVS